MPVLFMEGYISFACLLAYWMYPSMCYGMSLGLIGRVNESIGHNDFWFCSPES